MRNKLFSFVIFMVVFCNKSLVAGYGRNQGEQEFKFEPMISSSWHGQKLPVPRATTIFEAIDANDLAQLKTILESSSANNQLKVKNKPPLFLPLNDLKFLLGHVLDKHPAQMDDVIGDIPLFSCTTPLFYTLCWERLEIAKYLISMGANVKGSTVKGNSTLHIASCPQITKQLLEAGADFNALNTDKQTPLQQKLSSINVWLLVNAVHNNIIPLTQCALELIKYGARLDFAIDCLDNKNSELVKKLMSTALLYALKQNNQEYLTNLIGICENNKISINMFIGENSLLINDSASIMISDLD